MKPGIIVNVRPANYRERFHAAFAPIGWRIVDSPVLAPERMDAVLPDPTGFDAVIFTSQIAIEFLTGAAPWREKTAYAVGAATADAARRAGFSRTIQTGMNSKDLAEVLSTASFRQAFYPSAEDISADVSLDDPVRIRRLAVYRMTPATGLATEFTAEARAGSPVIVPLFSRRSARAVERLLAEAGITAQNTALCAVAISADVLRAEPGPWQRRAVADNPTQEAVVAKTAAVAADLTPGAHR